MGCCFTAKKKVSFDADIHTEDEECQAVVNDEEIDANDPSQAIPLNQTLTTNTDQMNEEKEVQQPEEDKATLLDTTINPVANPTDSEEIPTQRATSFVLVATRPEEQLQKKKSNRHEWRSGLKFDAMNHQIVFNISDAATNETYTARLGTEELNREVTIDEFNTMGEVMGTGNRKYMETDDGNCKVILSKGDIVYEFIALCNS